MTQDKIKLNEGNASVKNRIEEVEKEILEKVYLDNEDDFYSTESKLSTKTLLDAIKSKKQHFYWYNFEVVDKMLKEAIQLTLKSCSEEITKLKEEQTAKVEKFLDWLENGKHCNCSDCLKRKINEIFYPKEQEK